jgi:hypothetical protein
MRGATAAQAAQANLYIKESLIQSDFTEGEWKQRLLALIVMSCARALTQTLNLQD